MAPKQNHLSKKLALLIDGDNAQPSLMGKILTEAAKFGNITIRRVYGDWTTPQMKGWKEALNNHAVQPIQQFRYTVGKNATDSAMIIDAMDILHSEVVDTFCLVSSDSDYTRLATRIREEGLFVVGIGKTTTPKPFINACNIFTYTENLELEDEDLQGIEIASEIIANKDENIKNQEQKQNHNRRNQRPNPLPLLREAFSMAGDSDWVHLGLFGNYLSQLDPGFDPRTYGFKQLSQLLKGYKNFFELRFSESEGPSDVYVRLKAKSK
ncbi:MAG: NYN domain-containing protein [bacterium]